MTTLAAPGVNGRVRKTLSYQIDRLDAILDGLAGALNEAVADAVKQAVSVAVHEAVQAVITELMTNPEVARRLQGESGNAAMAAAAGAPAVPGSMGRVIKRSIAKTRATLARMPRMVKAMVRGVSTGLGQTVRTTWTASVASFRRTWSGFDGALRAAWSLRRPLTLSAAIGVSVAAACYLAGPVMMATLNGICGGATALVGMLVSRIRRMGKSTTVA